MLKWVEFEVQGAFALFSDPEQKMEPFANDKIILPSARDMINDTCRSLELRLHVWCRYVRKHIWFDKKR